MEMQKSSNSSKENSAACCQPSNSPADDSARILIKGNTEVIAQMNMINLTEEDLQLIAAFRPVIETEIEQITSSFYESILHVDSLKQIVIEHTTVERFRQTLKNHLIEMFDGRIDPAFIEKRLKIAMFHRKNGLAPKWYMGSFQNLLGTLMRIIDDRKEVYPDSKKLAQALTKLLSFEQQLVLEAYEDQTRWRRSTRSVESSGKRNPVTWCVHPNRGRNRLDLRDWHVDPSDQAIVATIISMAKHLNMNVIAEGIETQGQLDFLMENACKEIQGYYFSRPLPAMEVEEAFFMPVRELF